MTRIGSIRTEMTRNDLSSPKMTRKLDPEIPPSPSVTATATYQVGLNAGSSGQYSTAERDEQAQSRKFRFYRKCEEVAEVVAIEHSFL